MNVNSKYEQYRRIYPRLRVSWTCFHMWSAKQYTQLWSYLCDAKLAYTGAMRRGVELHDAVVSDVLIEFDQEPTQIFAEQQMKLTLPIGNEGEAVGQLDKLLIFPNRTAKIIDYKSGKWYSYYKDQIVFYALLAKMVKGIPVDEGFVVPIKWSDDYQQPVLNGRPTSIKISEGKMSQMYEKIKKCIYDISWRIDCGELDDFISSLNETSS